MKCSYCGADMVEHELFCRYCGTRRSREPQPQPESSPEFSPEPIPEPVSEPQPQSVQEPENYTADFEFSTKPESESATPAYRSVPESRPAYVPYGAPEQGVTHQIPRLQLPTKRGLGKMFFLGILTLGIYPLVIWCRIVTELNIAASRYDGERTMSYLGMTMLAAITLFIYPIVWIHGLCRRIGAELQRRDIQYKFGAGTFWLWNVLGALILVGPFIFIHKLMKAMNLINRDFNVRG